MPAPVLVRPAVIRAVGLMAAETSISIADVPSATSNVERTMVGLMPPGASMVDVMSPTW